MFPRPSNLVLTTATLAFSLLLAFLATQPPELRPASTSSDLISVERTKQTLAILLAEGVPHPVGSAANLRVKERLLELLDEAGIETEEQHAIGCRSSWPRCAFVENVIGTIPGQREETIVLMAHYDSVPSSPGAGDDAAGVATLIEVARLLALEPVPVNTLAFVFTDAEEDGLLGAEAFFAEHPIADRTRVVVNVEGSGSGGRVRLLRSTPGSGTIVDLFRAVAPAPVAQSMATEVFRRMPNDTDFSVAMRAGIKGLDFSFADERNHYHTPLDTVENLDPRTLQHHGDNILPLARALAEAELSSIGGEKAYSTVGSTWISWPESWTLPLALLAFLMLLASAWIARDDAGPWAILSGIGLFFLSVIGSALACAAMLWIGAKLAGGQSPWPANLWPWRSILIAAALLPALLLGRRCTHNWTLHLSVWLVWGALAISLAIVAPLAASVFLLPTLGAALVTFIGVWKRGQLSMAIVSVICAGTVGFLLFDLVLAMEASQGYLLAPTIYIPLALIATTILPVSANSGRGWRWLCVGCCGALLIGLAGTALTPNFDSWRPQYLNLQYLYDADAHQANWSASTSRPLSGSMMKVVPFARTESPIAPWSTRASGWTASAEAIETLPPKLQLVGEEHADDGRHLDLLLSSPRGASGIILMIAKEAGIRSIKVAGTPAGLPSTGRLESIDYLTLDIRAVPESGVLVSLVLSEPEPSSHYLVDRSYSLPPFAADLLDARQPLAVPVHSGDQTLTYTKVIF